MVRASAFAHQADFVQLSGQRMKNFDVGQKRLQDQASGLELRHGRMWLHPCLPEELNELSFATVYQNNELEVRIGHEAIRLRAARYAEEPAEIFINGEPCTIRPGETIERPLR